MVTAARTRRPRGGRADESVVSNFASLKAEYQFGQQSRFSSVKLGAAAVGTSADVHTRNDPTYFRMVETARYFEMNDRLCNAIVTRLCTNVCRAEVSLNPQTGDEGLDRDLKDRWNAWSTDPKQCDHRGKFPFAKAAKIALRRVIVDGDVLPVLLDTGAVQWMESQRLRTPSNALKRKDGRVPIHGVEKDERDRAVRYYFTNEDVDLRQSVARISDTTPIDAFDKQGNPQVLHLALQNRFTGSRGITSFAQTVDDPGQLSDGIFATLVKMQAQSCITFFRERDIGFTEWCQQNGIDGEKTESVNVADYMQDEVELKPGAERRGLPGEKLTGFTPTINSPEFIQFVRFVAQILAINLGVPLQLLLLDATETNFSGWKGAVEEARRRFDELLEEIIIQQLYGPTYLWQLRRWVAKDPVLRKFKDRDGIKLWMPKWIKPSWPSIQPVEDATANTLRLSTCQISPTELHQAQGRDWDDVYAEIIKDNAKAIRAAKLAAKEINGEFPDDEDKVRWFDLLPLVMREGVKISVQTGAAGETAKGKPAKNGATNAA